MGKTPIPRVSSYSITAAYAAEAQPQEPLHERLIEEAKRSYLQDRCTVEELEQMVWALLTWHTPFAMGLALTCCPSLIHRIGLLYARAPTIHGSTT